MNKKFLSAILAVIMLFTLSIPSFADENNIEEAGSTTSIPLNLTMNSALFSVTVPSSLPIEVMPDGSVQVATDAKITNNSQSQVVITDFKVEMASGWRLSSYSDDFTQKAANSKEIGISVNDIDAATGNLVDGFTPINSGAYQNINYKVKLAPQTESKTVGTIGYLLVTVGWAEDPVEMITFSYQKNYKEIISFEAEAGMTWGEFLNSEYHNGFFYVEGETVMGPDNYCVHDTMNGVTVNDVINPSYCYQTGRYATPEDI